MAMDAREKKVMEDVLDVVDCVEKGYFFLKKKCTVQDYIKGIQLTHKKLKAIHDEAPFKDMKPGIAKWCKMVLSEVVALERGIKSALPSREKTLAVTKTAIGVIHRLMDKVNLEGVKAKGEKFDPKFHEAIHVCKREDMGDNVIVKVFSRGYTLNGKLFKAARVLVNQKPDTPPAQAIRPNDMEYRSYMKKVGFFGEMYGMKDGAKLYGDYMKIQDYYMARVESKYGLDKFLPPKK